MNDLTWSARMDRCIRSSPAEERQLAFCVRRPGRARRRGSTSGVEWKNAMDGVEQFVSRLTINEGLTEELRRDGCVVRYCT